MAVENSSYCSNKKNKHYSTRFTTSEMWKICYRLLILVLVVASFPFINSPFPNSKASPPDSASKFARSNDQMDSSVSTDELLDHFFHDLTNEGLMKRTAPSKAVFLSSELEGSHDRLVSDYNMDRILLTDLDRQGSLLDGTVDFVYTSDFPEASEFIDRALKTGGVATVFLNDDPSAAFYKLPSNYKIAYMRRFERVAMAMKKTGPSSSTKLGSQRKLLGYIPEAKKAALQNLEDVLLEPPRAASGKSRVYLKRTRYLPDLMGDTLESYPRRVFIDVGLPEKDGGGGTGWFHKNYPTRNKNFEMYKIETVSEGSSAPQTEMSDWLRKNVKDEEYVVMKAEAEVVEEMMRSKAIMLVDELFLECKPHLKQWNNEGSSNSNSNRRGRRAYWECLALYGKLRDEGVAVHQWWG